MEGTELWIQQPGSPLAQRLFVGRLEGVEGPVLALLTEAGPRIVAVLVDDEAEFLVAELLATLPGSALTARGADRA